MSSIVGVLGICSSRLAFAWGKPSSIKSKYSTGIAQSGSLWCKHLLSFGSCTSFIITSLFISYLVQYQILCVGCLECHVLLLTIQLD